MLIGVFSREWARQAEWEIEREQEVIAKEIERSGGGGGGGH
jgi:hypothetical protein